MTSDTCRGNNGAPLINKNKTNNKQPHMGYGDRTTWEIVEASLQLPHYGAVKWGNIAIAQTVYIYKDYYRHFAESGGRGEKVSDNNNMSSYEHFRNIVTRCNVTGQRHGFANELCRTSHCKMEHIYRMGAGGGHSISFPLFNQHGTCVCVCGKI